MRRFQNKVAESRYTLPLVSLFGISVWLLCGLVQQQWWIQFACFVVSTYLMVELNNSNALIRIYSRTVSAAFVVMSCVACFLFCLMEGAIAQLCFVSSLLTLYHTYQDKQSMGWVFYTFMFVGMATLVAPHMFYLVPFYWLIMAGFIYSMSWRTFFASLLGLIFPYWVMVTWILWDRQGDFTPFVAHFSQLVQFTPLFAYDTLKIEQILSFAFVVVLSQVGVVHYLRTSFYDRIRIRQIYYCFILLNAVATVFMVLQPQHYDVMMRVLIVTASPLVAHFISLTSTRITNIAFYVMLGASLVLTALHIWISSSLF